MAVDFDDVQGNVASIFLSYFRRAPEFEAMQWYAGILQGLRADPVTAASAFKRLTAQIYADGVANEEVPAGPTVTDAWYLAYLYGSILGRAPDATGLAYWAAQLQNGGIERAELVGTFIASALAAGGRDAGYVQHRTLVALEFAQWANSNPQVLPSLKYNAAEVLLGVDETWESVLAAQDRLETHAGPIGAIWNLTTGIDTLEGTHGNDTFNAVYQGDGTDTSASTLTAFDHIDGGLGVDTLNIHVGKKDGDHHPANWDLPANTSISNINVVNLFLQNQAGPDLRDVGNYGGIEQFWVHGHVNQNILNVGAGVLVGFADIASLVRVPYGDDHDPKVAVLLAEGVAAVALALHNVGSRNGDAIINPQLRPEGKALSSVNVSGTLALAVNDLELKVTAGRNIDALAINTAVNTRLEVRSQLQDGTVATRLQTLDLSRSTGDVELLIDAEQADHLVTTDHALTVTFGSGDDVITFVSSQRGLGLRDRIDGGEGHNTVVLADAGSLQTQRYDAIDRLQNIQQLGFIGHDAQVDASRLTDFNLLFAGTGNVALSHLAAGQQVTVARYQGDAPDRLTLFNAAASIAIDVGDDVALHLRVAAGKDDVGARSGTLTLAGDGLVLFSNAGSGKFSTLDASKLEGRPQDLTTDHARQLGLIPPDSTAISNVTISLGLALFDLADGFQTFLSDFSANPVAALTELRSGMSGDVAEAVLLNAGTLDVIAVGVGSGGAEGARNSSTYGKMDVIEGFNSNADAGPLDLLLGGTASLGKMTPTLSANDNTLPLAFQAAAQASVTSDADVIYFVFEGDTYLFADTADGKAGQYDNSDFALKIVGVHGQLEKQWLVASEL